MAAIRPLALSLNSLSLKTVEPSSNVIGGHEHTASCFTNAESCPSIGTNDAQAFTSPSTQYKEAGEFATKVSELTEQTGQTSLRSATTDDKGEGDHVLTPAEEQDKKSVFDPLLRRGWTKVNETTIKTKINGDTKETKQYSNDCTDAADPWFPVSIAGYFVLSIAFGRGIIWLVYQVNKAAKEIKRLKVELDQRNTELVRVNAENAAWHASGAPTIVASIVEIQRHLEMRIEEPSGVPPDYTSPLIGTAPARQPTANEADPAGGEEADPNPGDPFIGGDEINSIQMNSLAPRP